MFNLYHSNQLDVLKELLAVLIERQPQGNPLDPEIVLVQSPGMAQWLQIQLAERFGIAANIAFPLPATFIWNMFTRVLPNIPPESAFNKDEMTWKLMALLPGQLPLSDFAPLRHYLSEDQHRRKIHQLSVRIADLFDQYLVYRPDWLMAWENHRTVSGLGPDQPWQAALWRMLVAYTRELGQAEWHRANLYQHFMTTLQNTRHCPPGLPKRVFILGVSALPPFYLQTLQALGQHIDIHLLFTNPCRFYWGDIQANPSFVQCAVHQKKNPSNCESIQHSINNNMLFDQQVSHPLLASWGKLGRDNLYLLAQQEGIQEIDAFVEIEPDTLLHRLQRDVLELDDRAQFGMAAETAQHSAGKQLLTPADRSVSFHLCHSAQREVEVLHDQLLHLFDQDPTLTVKDVIVMVANIDSYTPYIQAVFGNAPSQSYLPFTISDRSAKEIHPILPTFIKLLSLAESRFSAESILGLLEVPALSKRFGIKERDLRVLRRWVKETGIRWGLDDETQHQLNLPPTGQHTWQFGVNRMLLGYAMDSRIGQWQEILPYDESSGLTAGLVGQLATLLSQLTQWRAQLGEDKTLSEWSPLCRLMLEAFFVLDSDTEAVLAVIEQQWQNVIKCGLAAGYVTPIPLVVLRDELESRLEQQHISQRFLAGTINFCTFMPMRSIPFKVVCLLGMNDGVYPRSLPTVGFDLMVNQARRGDRSRRDDDRYLFLEALLSAKDYFYISYLSKSIQDDSTRYPSVLVSELLEYIGYSHVLPGDQHFDPERSAQRVIEHLSHQYPRMPFSAENFLPDTPWQSYAAEWLPAALGQGAKPIIFGQTLSPNRRQHLAFEDLRRFFRHPIKAFFQQRLKVNFAVDETALADEEPFIIDHLDNYHIKTQLLNSLVEGGEPESEFIRLKAAGILPYGAFGEIYWQQQYLEMQTLANKIRLEKAAHQSLELIVDTGETTLLGWLDRVQGDGLLRWRATKLSIVEGLQLWLEHLAYCAQGGTGESRMYGRENSVWRFMAIPRIEAQALLDQVISGYWRGMQEPIWLLPNIAWEWLNRCFDRQTGQIIWDTEVQQKAKERLVAAWQGSQYRNDVQNDFYLQRICRNLGETEIEQIIEEAQRYLLPLAERQALA